MIAEGLKLPIRARARARTRYTADLFFLISGVVLPVMAIAFEALTAICAEASIDPMPSIGYIVLLICVPACNLSAWLGLRRDALQYSRLFAAMTGFSGVVALYYTIILLPIMPLAAFGLIVLVPILAFSPVLSLWMAIKLMRAWAGFAGSRTVALGAACGAIALVLLALPAIELRAAAVMVRSERVWVRETGYRFLRFDGVRHALLEACYVPIGRTAVSQEEARLLYYRAWGKSFDSETAPRWRRRGVVSFDELRGGEKVGPTGTAVGLSASRIDGSVDARSAMGYFEWTMVLHNSSAVQQEARMELAMPPGGVVSRATLWIHGAEREAAFGERGQVRQAYQNVVRMRRDPLLVTTSGRDRILVQCFPIEPAGDMKIRIGMTMPVVPEGLSDRGIITLPAIVERNFASVVPASVWIESKTAVSGPFDSHVREDGVNVMRGTLRESDRASVRLSGLNWDKTWAPEKASDPERLVEQRFLERTIAAPERVVVVVDGSESMREMRNEIGAALATIPDAIESGVIVAARTGATDWESASVWEGGVDAVPALEAAFRRANDARRTTVMWIAGAQPAKIAGSESIRQTLERERGRSRLTVLASGGVNVIMRDLEGLPGVESVPRSGSVTEDLARLFARWRGDEAERFAERRIVERSEAPKDVKQGSSHMVRLWAAGEAARLAERDRAAAVALAVEHHIVTPLSGAVVLETAAQYTQNGLQPASGSAVPTMPEPETWGLLAAGLAVAGVFAWRRRYRAA